MLKKLFPITIFLCAALARAADIPQAIKGTVDVGSVPISSISVNNLPLTAFGELSVAQMTPVAAWRFDYGVNTRLVTVSTASNGTATVDQSRCKLQTSTQTAGSAAVSSIRRLRYLPGVGGLMRMTAVFDVGTASSTQIIGIGDSQDGLFFGYNGTAFGIDRRRAGVDNWTSSTSWNGAKLGEALNPQFGNIYQIRYQWLGYGIIHFYVFDRTVGSFVDVHDILYPNTSTLTTILNPTIPLISSVTNSGNNTNLTLYTPSAIGALEGGPQTHTAMDPLTVWNAFDSPAQLAVSDSNNNHAVTIQNKATFQNVKNRVPVAIRSLSIVRDLITGGNVTTVRVYRNATTTGAFSFVDVDTNNSPVATSTTTTTIVAGNNSERSFLISAANPSLTVNFEMDELVAYPGDTITLAVQDSASTGINFTYTINWEELF